MKCLSNPSCTLGGINSTNVCKGQFKWDPVAPFAEARNIAIPVLIGLKLQEKKLITVIVEV